MSSASASSDTATYFNAATTFDATTYISRAPAATLDKLLAIEAARREQRCKTVGEAEFAREREVVVNEIKQRDQASEVYGVLHGALYPEGHPYRRPIGGSVADVGAITREQACAFEEAYYAPGNAVLVVSGPLPRVELDDALAKLGARITKRVGATPHRPVPAPSRPQHLEVAAPIDEDILVLAWPLPLDPVLQVKVRAIGATLSRLVDAEIKGSVVGIELGDRSAPMLGLAMLRGDDETFQQAIDGARRGIEKLPDVFRKSQPESFDELVFDRTKEGAIHALYLTFEDGSDRDERLASYVSAGREPRDAMASELQALRGLAREEAADLASRYLAASAPAMITLKASAGKKRGNKTKLSAPIHDFGQRRTPVDPAAARRPMIGPRTALADMRTRLASFIILGGWVDASRTAAAVALVRDRVAELRRDATAAARAFVIARGHVLTALRSRVGSAAALASRVEHEVELAREPLSDLQTALVVEALTIAEMSAALAELDLARATVLMNGPSAELTAAFKTLDRKPIYVQPPPPPSSAPGATALAFKGAEHLVYRSELRAALTEQPPPRLMWTLSATAARAVVDGSGGIFTGYSLAAGVGYRYGWNNGVGVRVSMGRLATEGTDPAGMPATLGLIPVDVLGLWHLGGDSRSWGDVLLGLHLERLADTSTSWRAAAMFGLQVGYDVFQRGVHRVSVGARFESTAKSDISYATLGVGLVYRQ